MCHCVLLPLPQSCTFSCRVADFVVAALLSLLFCVQDGKILCDVFDANPPIFYEIVAKYSKAPGPEGYEPMSNISGYDPELFDDGDQPAGGEAEAEEEEERKEEITGRQDEAAPPLPDHEEKHEEAGGAGDARKDGMILNPDKAPEPTTTSVAP